MRWWLLACLGTDVIYAIERKEEQVASWWLLVGLGTGVIVIVGLLLARLKRSMEQVDYENQRRVEAAVRTAVAESVAHRFKVADDEVLKAIDSANFAPKLHQRIKDEITQCRVTFNQLPNRPVMLTILIYWRDGSETKIEQEWRWEAVPQEVRAHLIRTGQPYSYTWQLPESSS